MASKTCCAKKVLLLFKASQQLSFKLNMLKRENTKLFGWPYVPTFLGQSWSNSLFHVPHKYTCIRQPDRLSWFCWFGKCGHCKCSIYFLPTIQSFSFMFNNFKIILALFLEKKNKVRNKWAAIGREHEYNELLLFQHQMTWKCAGGGARKTLY